MSKSLLSPLLVTTTFIFSGLLLAAENPVEEVHELTLQWTGIEHQKDLLQANWRQDKPILEQQLALLERERSELSALLEDSVQEQDEVQQRRLELIEQQTKLEQEQVALKRTLDQSYIKLVELRSQLPPPLVDSWDLEMTRLNSPLLTDSERLQLVLELLRQLDDFQQKITVHETVMTLANGSDYLVKQVYLGLSHGWYVTADQSLAAAGRPTPQGWQWSDIDDGLAVAQIIDILERRMNPELISIPLQLTTLQGGN